MKRLLITLCLILSSSAAHAKWSGLGTINNVYSHNGLHIIDTTVADNMCAHAGKFYWPASSSEFEDADDMFAMALAALMAQKTVRFVYNENQAICQSGATRVTHMMIAKD